MLISFLYEKLIGECRFGTAGETLRTLLGEPPPLRDKYLGSNAFIKPLL
jgi:hypothetical protein